MTCRSCLGRFRWPAKGPSCPHCGYLLRGFFA